MKKAYFYSEQKRHAVAPVAPGMVGQVLFDGAHKLVRCKPQDKMTTKRIYDATILLPKKNDVGKLELSIGHPVLDDPLNLVHNQKIYLTILNFERTKEIGNKIVRAVLHYKPFVDFTFFKIGEKYGKTDKTKVTRENTLIKDITFYQDNTSFNLADYYHKVACVPLKGKPVTLMLSTIGSNNEMDDYDNYGGYDFKSPDSSEYYNDNLDMDQQSPEFWDDIT